MEPGGSIPYSQGLSKNPYLKLHKTNYPHWYLSLQGPFEFCPIGLPVKNFESTPTFLHSGYMPCPSIIARNWWRLIGVISECARSRQEFLSLKIKLTCDKTKLLAHSCDLNSVKCLFEFKTCLEKSQYSKHSKRATYIALQETPQTFI